jgi:signal transduction histidine kinase
LLSHKYSEYFVKLTSSIAKFINKYVKGVKFLNLEQIIYTGLLILLASALISLSWGIFHFKIFDLVPIARATVIENMDSGYMVLDLQDRILDINPTFQNFIKPSSPSVLYKQVQEVCHEIPELIQLFVDRKVLHTEISIERDNTTHYYEVSLSQIINGKGEYIGKLVVLNDETQKKLEQLDFLNHQKQMVILKERSIHARDIHDNLGQILGFINLQAQGIQKELTNAGIDIALASLNKLVDVTQHAHNDMRTYLQEINSSCTHPRQFLCILKELIETFKSQTEINVSLDIPCDFFDSCIVIKTQDHLLNIIRETLNNIRKHSHANEVKIQLSFIDNQICFSIEDNGVGFDKASTMCNPLINFGLNSMTSRATEIGGSVNIVSILGQGTRIEFYGPKKEVCLDESNAS